MTHFPDHPHDGETVAEEIGPDQARIWTYNEAKNEWTYKDYGPGGQLVFTDQVLVRDNAEVPGMALADPSELKTQKEVNYWLDEKAGQGGGGAPGKETLPWLQINKWGMRKNPYSGNPIYEVSWSNNPNCTYTWQYEIDGDGDGNWIDIADHPQKDALGYTPGGEFPIQLSLSGSGQADILPNALMRFRITGELNGILSELSSGVIAAWEERMEEYEPPLYETGISADLEPYATTEYVDQKVEEYLPLTGGTANKMTGILYLGGNKIAGVADPELATDAANKSYVETHTLQPDKSNDVTTGFRVKADGKTLISSSGNELGLFNVKTPSAASHAATKGYVDQQIGAIEIPEAGGGVGFTEEYNGNRYYKTGLETTTLSEGEVMFLQGGVTTSVFAAVTHVALPEAGIDWTKFTRTGTIEVKNGSTLCGHLQVISAVNNPGRNWVVKVKMLDIVSNELEPESGHPCYFWGMFTG